MMNTVDESVYEGPIEIGMNFCRMVQGKKDFPPTVFWYKVWYVSPYRVLDLNWDLTQLVWVKDPQGSPWWFFETEFRRRFVSDAIFSRSA